MTAWDDMPLWVKFALFFATGLAGVFVVRRVRIGDKTAAGPVG